VLAALAAAGNDLIAGHIIEFPAGRADLGGCWTAWMSSLIRENLSRGTR
jgi:hypothetical protein